MLQCWESMARTGGCAGGSFKSANQKAVGTARGVSLVQLMVQIRLAGEQGKMS